MLVSYCDASHCKRSWVLCFMVQVQPAEIGVGPCYHDVGCINPCCMCWLLRQDQQFSNVLPCSSPLLHIASLLCLPPHQLLLQPLSLSFCLSLSLSVSPTHSVTHCSSPPSAHREEGGHTYTNCCQWKMCFCALYSIFLHLGRRFLVAIIPV